MVYEEVKVTRILMIDISPSRTVKPLLRHLEFDVVVHTGNGVRQLASFLR